MDLRYPPILLVINLQRDILEDFAEVRRSAGFDDFLRMEKWFAARIEKQREYARDYQRSPKGKATRKIVRKAYDQRMTARLRSKRPTYPFLLGRFRPENFGWSAARPTPKRVTKLAELPRSPRCAYCATCGRQLPSPIAAKFCCPTASPPSARVLEAAPRSRYPV